MEIQGIRNKSLHREFNLITTHHLEGSATNKSPFIIYAAGGLIEISGSVYFGANYKSNITNGKVNRRFARCAREAPIYFTVWSLGH